MAISPVSGALSQTQLAALEQIRALRAAKSAAPTQATTSVQSAAPVQTKPVAVQLAPAQSLATVAATAGPMPTNRPRGSILDVTV
jgi:hypothetical protein